MPLDPPHHTPANGRSRYDRPAGRPDCLDARVGEPLELSKINSELVAVLVAIARVLLQAFLDDLIEPGRNLGV
jgi:hypothetical protein